MDEKIEEITPEEILAQYGEDAAEQPITQDEEVNSEEKEEN